MSTFIHLGYTGDDERIGAHTVNRVKTTDKGGKVNTMRFPSCQGKLGGAMKRQFLVADTKTNK